MSELLALGQIQLEGAEEGQGDAGSEAGLYSESQLRRVREWTATQRPRPGPLLKVLVSAGEREALSEFVELLRESTDFVLDGRLARDPELLAGVCAIGHIPLNDGLSLRLLAIPTDPTYRPLWDVACHGMLGGIILPCLEDEASVGHTEAVFRRIRECSGAPVVQVALGSRGDEVPPAAAKRVERIGGDGLFGVPDASGVRELFARLVP